MTKIINEQLSISNSLPLKARFYSYKYFTYPWHFHAEYEIIYVKESTGTRFIGNNKDTFAAGDVLLLGADLPHYIKSDEMYQAVDSQLSVTGTIIQFEPNFMHSAINHYPHFLKIKKMLEDSNRGIYFPAASSVKLRAFFDTIPLQNGMEQMISFLQLLKEMSEIKNQIIISSTEFTSDTQHDTSRIDKVISYINQHYTRSIKLDEIASLAAMNPAAFCRFFKAKTGKTLKNYILNMRIGYACKLLLVDKLTVLQISVECGFDTISYFNKVFKKTTGYTPSQYRDMML